MRPAVFKKVTDGIIKLKDLSGNVIFLKRGEDIVGYYELFNGLPGLRFERYIEDGKVENTENVEEKMKPAVFKKVTDGIIKLKDLSGNVIFLKRGEDIVGYYEMFNGLPGLQFQYFRDSIKTTEDKTIQVTDNVYNIVQIPTKEQLQSIPKPTFVAPDNSEPPDNPNADKACPKCRGRGKYSFGGSYGGPVYWSVCECVMFKPEPPPKPAITKGFDDETLKSLKAKNPREWMLMKKGELKEIMDNAGIDYSQVEDDRMSLYKFLFSIIKDLP